MVLTFKTKKKPYPHQGEIFDSSKKLPKYAIFWEQGTGKSKVVIDCAANLYVEGEINTLFVVAPNGVHRNWVVSELQAHLQDDILKNTYSFAFFSSKKGNKSHKAGIKKAIAHKGFVVVAMSYDAFITAAGKEFAQQILKKRTCMYVLDESTRIGNPKSKRTKAILGSAKFGKYRRILTGTPVADSPFKIYTQFRFLDLDYWKAKGLGSYSLFKNYFGEFFDAEIEGGRTVKILKQYKNLDELSEIIAGDSSRVTKKVLGLPDKIYTTRFFEMSAKQKKLYKKLCDEFLVEVEPGLLVSAELPIVRMMRLQQIAGGFIGTERIPEGANVEDQWVESEKVLVELVTPDKNPRLRLLADIIEDTPGKMIIWAKFTYEIDAIVAMLNEKSITAVRYDGAVKDDARAHAIDSFQGGEHENARFFVANQAAAATGLTLTAATVVVYYSNDFSLENRQQSEDRAHRIGQESSVLYIDLQAIDTIDGYVTDTLRGKHDISAGLLRDDKLPWI